MRLYCRERACRFTTADLCRVAAKSAFEIGDRPRVSTRGRRENVDRVPTNRLDQLSLKIRCNGQVQNQQRPTNEVLPTVFRQRRGARHVSRVGYGPESWLVLTR